VRSSGEDSMDIRPLRQTAAPHSLSVTRMLKPWVSADSVASKAFSSPSPRIPAYSLSSIPMRNERTRPSGNDVISYVNRHRISLSRLRRKTLVSQVSNIGLVAKSLVQMGHWGTKNVDHKFRALGPEIYRSPSQITSLHSWLKHSVVQVRIREHVTEARAFMLCNACWCGWVSVPMRYQIPKYWHVRRLLTQFDGFMVAIILLDCF
jgi:hypothetical protein